MGKGLSEIINNFSRDFNPFKVVSKKGITLLTALFLSAYSPVNSLANENNLEEGKFFYKQYCEVCHGEKGQGDGVNSAKMDPAPRDLSDNGREKYMIKRTEEELFKVISLGGREIEKSSLMPFFGKTLSEKEIWSVVSYISELCETKGWNIDFSREMNSSRPEINMKSVVILEPTRRDKMMGKRAYSRYGCSGCHEIKGRGGESGPELDGIGSKLKPEQIYQITQNARAFKDDSRMPVYDLNEETAISITKYLMTLE